MSAHQLTATQAAIVSMNVPHKHLMDETVFDGLFSGKVPVWEILPERAMRQMGIRC